MSTKYVAIGVVVLIIAAALYAYFSYSSGSADQPSGASATAESQDQNQSAAVPENQAAGAFTGSMADLLAREGAWKCTFDATNAAAHSWGDVYVSGGKLRGDFSSEVQQLNQTVDSHMIQDNGYVYVWTALAPQGFKAKTTLGTEDATTQFSGQGVDINQQYSYNCVPWSVDSSMFALPSGIVFAE